MEKSIPFMKMHGAGNDFIMIDNRKDLLSGKDRNIIKQLCERRFGIGADGLILIKFKNPDEINLEYFNPDGNKAEMCGNGARCAVYFIHLMYRKLKNVSVEISQKLYLGEITASRWVRISWSDFPVIQHIKELQEIISDEFEKFLFVNSDVPHLILLVESGLYELDVKRLGGYYRNHPVFAPQGVNVDFVTVKNNEVEIRTYERGVEGETTACGTGAVAVAFAIDFWGIQNYPVILNTQGGTLKVGCNPDREGLWLEGPVKKVYSGYFYKNEFTL